MQVDHLEQYGQNNLGRIYLLLLHIHQAFLTTEALDNIAKTSIENLINFNKGTPIRENEVCYMCKNQTECKKLLKEKCF